MKTKLLTVAALAVAGVAASCAPVVASDRTDHDAYGHTTVGSVLEEYGDGSGYGLPEDEDCPETGEPTPTPTLPTTPPTTPPPTQPPTPEPTPTPTDGTGTPTPPTSPTPSTPSTPTPSTPPGPDGSPTPSTPPVTPPTPLTPPSVPPAGTPRLAETGASDTALLGGVGALAVALGAGAVLRVRRGRQT